MLLMKKQLIFLICFSFLGTLFSCAPGIKGSFKVSPDYPYDSQTRVAVLPFSITTNVDDESAGERLSNLISSELIPYYKIVEREQINMIMKQLGFEIGGAVSDNTLPQLGQMLGVQAAVLGKVFEFTDRKKAGRKVYLIDANIRMIDIQTSAMIWSINCKLEHSAPSLYEFSEIYAAKFAKKLYRELARRRRY